MDHTTDVGKQVARQLEMSIAPALIKRGRLAEAGELFHAPLDTLKRRAEMHAGTKARFGPVPDRAGVIEHMEQGVRDCASELVTVLRASGRFDEATAIDVEARRLDPSEAMARALDEARLASADPH